MKNHKIIKELEAQNIKLGELAHKNLNNRDMYCRFLDQIDDNARSIEAIENNIREEDALADDERIADGLAEIARRSRGTPRTTNRLLRRVRDYAQVKADGIITKQVAQEGLKLLDIDGLGLDIMDRKFLQTIISKFNGGPVGIDTLSMAISEEKDTIEAVYEPYLLQEGFIQRTPRGRVATKLAYEHLGKNYKNIKQKSLF